MRRANRGVRGFSLLEVVVTLAVLSISLTVLFRVFSSVTMTAGMTSDYFEALKIAETRMSLLAEKASLSSSGTVDDYYHWKARVERYTAGFENKLPGGQSLLDIGSGNVPYLLTVSVSWGSNRKREVELSTIRLGMTP